MKKITAAILAHVDAGKTTLAEAMLHACGALRVPGRVDEGSAALDSAPQERLRGITVFAGEACLNRNGTEINLLDTPGHVDFSAETERDLSAADAAILVISGLNGVQAHTASLWRLLAERGLPVILFVSKMDMGRRSREELLADIKKQLDDACLPLDELLMPGEEAAMQDETLLEKYLGGEALSKQDGLNLIRGRKAFPVLFGSGLKSQGVDALLDLLCDLSKDWEALDSKPFKAGIYKISYDEKGTRLCHVKVLSGAVKPRDEIETGADKTEKAAQIRRYTGGRFRQEEGLSAGSTGVLTGLSGGRAGQMIGDESAAEALFFEPVMRYSLTLPEGLAPEQAMPVLLKLGEEEPTLNLHYEASVGEIKADLMGPVQGEILEALIRERFGWETHVEKGRILYKETLTAPVEGVGHYEPLRHYAEVHLALRPLPRGSGLVYRDEAARSLLEGDMRRLILGQLAQKQHRGVIIGAPVTDMEISLIGGRYHEKHTEGGDFREAAWRAVRQGLMRAKANGFMHLLEPLCRFEIVLPAEKLGRAMADMENRSARTKPPEADGDLQRLAGTAPLASLRDYAAVLAAYTSGKGRLTLQPAGYGLCSDEEAVAAAFLYDPAGDRENPPDSVFCSNGGGFSVPWDKVPSYMHLPFLMKEAAEPAAPKEAAARRRGPSDDEALEALMLKEFGPIKRPAAGGSLREYTDPVWREPVQLKGPDRLIIDGYNLIFAWEEMKKLADKGLDYLREELAKRLQNYAAYSGRKILLVFDGYRVSGNAGTEEERPPLTIVYTKENETADAYIERILEEGKKDRGTAVISNDNLIRLSSIRDGALRMRCEEFAAEYEEAVKQIAERLERKGRIGTALI